MAEEEVTTEAKSPVRIKVRESFFKIKHRILSTASFLCDLFSFISINHVIYFIFKKKEIHFFSHLSTMKKRKVGSLY